MYTIKEIARFLLGDEPKKCDHDIESRTEVTHLCNVRHDSQNRHKTCDDEYCRFRRDDCPHIFGFQECDCGAEFIGKLGEFHDPLDKLEEEHNDTRKP